LLYNPKTMTVITGGSGFLGEYLVRAFAAMGSVRSIDVLDPSERLSGVEYVRADVRDAARMEELIRGADIVIHNAALVPLSRADKTFHDVNVGGTRNVLNAARAASVRKIVYVSSSAVFGVPTTSGAITEHTPLAPFEAYGISKAEAESVCHEFREWLDVSIVRPRTILGPGRMGLLSLVFDWVSENRPVFILGPGKNRYQFVSGEELAADIVSVATIACKNEDFNVGTSRFGTLRDDMEAFIKNVGSTSKVISVSPGLARAVLPILSFLHLVPFVSYQYTIADKDVFFDTTKLKTFFDRAPEESNADMLARTYRWYLTHTSEATASIHRKPLKKGILVLLKYVSKLWG